MVDGGEHAACVDAWLEETARGLTPPALRRLLEVAFGALWMRTITTLGEVTLAAIGERVLYTAAERFPVLASFRVVPTRGIELGGTEGQGPPDESELREGMRFLLIELLTVLGSLTAEILTPELHAQLRGVVLPSSVHLVKEMETPPGARKRHGGEGGE